MSFVDADDRLDAALAVAVLALAVYVVGFLLYYAYTLGMSRVRYLNYVVGPGIALFYLDQYRRFRGDDADGEGSGPTGRLAGLVGDRATAWGGRAKALVPHLYPVLAVVVVAVAVYVELNFQRLQFVAPTQGTTVVDNLVGLVLIAVTIHATKVAYGWTISLVTLFTVFYALNGPLFPGIFRHSGMSLAQVAKTGAIGLSGVYGFIMGIGATWVAVFIVFAGMAKSFGLLEYVLAISEEFSDLLQSGIVHVAVISSLFIGSLTGSAAANTATTGSFTIPMMKRQNVPGEYAAAIESVASSGAQIMPPVMGVAAFLMADILGLPYVTVIQAGTLPAVLFYVAVAVGIHLLILKNGWTVERGDDGFDAGVLVDGAYFGIPLVVLVYTLVVMRLTPLSAGLYSIVALLAVHLVATVARGGPTRDTAARSARDVLAGVREGALEFAPLVGVLGAMGVIVAMVAQTGLSQKLSSEIIGLAGGVFLALLVLAMLTSILFGLGMPTPAAYILVVFLVAPALIQSGVRELAAHYYVFYFAMLSAITPPVAISVAIGSRIADTRFLPTALQALRIGAPGFVLPYAFLTNDALVYWSFPATPIAFVIVLVGLGLLAAGLVGHDGATAVGYPLRVALLLTAGGVLFGPRVLQVGAVAVGVVLVAVNRRLFRTIVDGAGVRSD